jgi:hypothetical protein
VSDESIQVLQHFGPEAPALLNQYSCVVEDALINQTQVSSQAVAELQQLGQRLQALETQLGATLEDNQAYNLLTTDPDLLADYVNEFFGPEGPYPQELEKDRLAADVAQYEETRMARMAGNPAAAARQAAYQRPQMEMTAPAGQPMPQGQADLSAILAQTPPERHWQVLAQMGPEALRSKQLISMDPF